MSSHASPPLSINVNYTNSKIQDNILSKAKTFFTKKLFNKETKLCNNNPNTDFDCMTILRCDPKLVKLIPTFHR